MQPLVDSYYEATALREQPSPPLAGEESCDVCVIGGGFTGVSAALNLAERGFSVVVLEAERIGWGASGRSGGQIIHGFGGDWEENLPALGFADLRPLFEMSKEAMAIIRERVARHHINCDLRDGWILAAIKNRHRKNLEDYAATLSRLNYPCELLNGSGVRRAIASDRYVAALRDLAGGHLHPLNYLLGLAKAAKDAGVAFFEGSRVVSIKKTAAGPRAKTESGEVKCRHLVIACNAYLDELMPPLRRRVMPVGTYICATEPLGEERIGTLIPQNEAVCDMNFVLDYFRRSADSRMLFGGRVSYTTLTPPNLRTAMRRRMLAVFPQLADAKAEFVWGGNVAITINRLPDFGRIGGDIFYAQGFSGQGVALTGLAGRLLAEAIAGSAERFDVFTKIRHRNFFGGKLLRAPILALAMLYYRLRDAL